MAGALAEEVVAATVVARLAAVGGVPLRGAGGGAWETACRGAARAADRQGGQWHGVTPPP